MVLGWQRPGRVGRRRIQSFLDMRKRVLFVLHLFYIKRYSSYEKERRIEKAQHTKRVIKNWDFDWDIVYEQKKLEPEEEAEIMWTEVCEMQKSGDTDWKRYFRRWLWDKHGLRIGRDGRIYKADGPRKKTKRQLAMEEFDAIWKNGGHIVE